MKALKQYNKFKRWEKEIDKKHPSWEEQIKKVQSEYNNNKNMS